MRCRLHGLWCGRGAMGGRRVGNCRTGMLLYYIAEVDGGGNTTTVARSYCVPWYAGEALGLMVIQPYTARICTCTANTGVDDRPTVQCNLLPEVLIPILGRCRAPCAKRLRRPWRRRQPRRCAPHARSGTGPAALGGRALLRGRLHPAVAVQHRHRIRH